MKKKLTLYNPFTVIVDYDENDKPKKKRITELEYDDQKTRVGDYAKASAKAEEIAFTETESGVIVSPDFNTNFHLYIGMYIILRSNPELTLDDLEENLCGSDIDEVKDIGRNFIVTRPTVSKSKPSERSSDSTPGSTAQE